MAPTHSPAARCLQRAAELCKAHFLRHLVPDSPPLRHRPLEYTVAEVAPTQPAQQRLLLPLLLQHRHPYQCHPRLA